MASDTDHAWGDVYSGGAPANRAESGMVILACDHPRIQIHYIPSMGHAPR